MMPEGTILQHLSEDWRCTPIMMEDGSFKILQLEMLLWGDDGKSRIVNDTIMDLLCFSRSNLVINL